MAEHPIQGLMDTALKNIKSMIDVNTIVGTPVTAPDGTVIIPISKVGFGFAAGGSEFGNPLQKEDGPKSNFGGGSGAGVSISPVAFLVVGNGAVRLLSLSENSSAVERIIDMVPEIMTKVTDAFAKKEEKGSPKPVKIEKISNDLDEIIITE